MISFQCQHCNNPLEVGDDFAGSEGQCPFCGQSIQVPGEPPPEVNPEAYRKAPVGRVVAIIAGAVGLIVLVVILLVYGTGGSLLNESMEQAKRVECSNNLKNIGMGLKIYASCNRGNRFPSLYSKPSDSRFGQEAWGGDVDEDTFMIEGMDRAGANKGVALEDTEPMRSNQHCLWMLVRDGSCSVNTLQCPSDDMAEEDASTIDPNDWWNFEKLTHCSYSYQNQFGRNSRDGLEASLVIAADKSPGRIDVDGDSPPGEDDPDKWHTWNSPNHDWKGQNCLYADGHVEFTDTPYCGYANNNIWIGEEWDAAGRDWTPTDTEYARYHDTIVHRRDSWLVP